jgi:tetratricopeptide (TPR) repeat protein
MDTTKHKTFDLAAARSLEAGVWQQLERDDIKRAIADCEQLNRTYPDFAPGWNTASHLALRLNKPRAALAAADRALAIDPENAAWLLQKALCIAKLGQVELLGPLVDGLLTHDLKTAYQCSALAMLLTQLGRREDAVILYEKAAALKPDESRHYYNIACLQRSLGDTEAAEHNFDKAISLDPTDFEAYKIRSELRKQTPARNHVEALELLLSAGISDVRGRAHIFYALAKELEDLDEPQRSFHYLKLGADTRRGYMQYDVKRDLDTMAAIREAFSADVFANEHRRFDNDEAIFVLGLPRTGTTLVERILSSHSDVFAAGELTNFAAQMMAQTRRRVGQKSVARDELVRLTTQLDFAALGEAYINSTRPFTGRTRRFIDKLPLNYLYVGLIHLALPRAKIINLQRHPLDTCYAIYKQLFVDAYPFSYDLEELGRYYVAYDELMRHWGTVLPGVVYTVRYEELVGDVEHEARQLLDYCELDWQSQCLRFYENKDASTTASTVQVRQPVYQSSVGKWKHYREQLEPLTALLDKAGIDLGN